MVLAIWKALDETKLRREEEPKIRVFLLSAKGRMFCSGADARDLMQKNQQEQMAQEEKNISGAVGVGTDGKQEV